MNLKSSLLSWLAGHKHAKSMVSVSSLLTFVLLFLISPGSFAGHLSDILQGVSEADKKHNYQGTFILRKADDLSTMRVTHGSNEQGIWETLETLDGESRKVVRRNYKVISVFPERELVTIRNAVKSHSLHRQLPENFNQLEQYYSLKLLPDDRIANHQVLVVDLIPTDKLRYGYRYWVDKNTGMLLRCDLIDENNRVVEQMMFTSLEYLAQMPALPFDLKQFEHFQQQLLDEPEADVKNSASLQWAIKALPRGFMLTQSTRRYSGTAEKRPEENTGSGKKDAQLNLLHLVFSDGLASVSVFIEKNLRSAKRRQGGSAMGAVNAYSRPAGEYFITVVGEVPVKTVQAMALSTVRLP